MNYHPAGSQSPRRVVIAAGVAIIVLLSGIVVLNCSGLSFPIINPRGDLNRRLERDFFVRLPASAVVDRSDRVAYLDSSRAYSLHMAPADAVTFFNQLSAAAAARGYSVDPAAGPGAVKPPYRPPAWWVPLLPGATYFHATSGGSQTSQFDYGAVCSPSTGRVYIYRSEM